jgi:hypothetical protein
VWSRIEGLGLPQSAFAETSSFCAALVGSLLENPKTNNTFLFQAKRDQKAEGLETMKPDQSIEMQLVNGNGKPVAIANVMIDLSFYTKGNFRYRFGVGRTDDSGRLTVSYADVETIRQQYVDFDLMDYITLKLTPPNRIAQDYTVSAR